jgi:hypothetical protein
LEAKKPYLIEVMADPNAHLPLSLFAGTLDTEPAI